MPPADSEESYLWLITVMMFALVVPFAVTMILLLLVGVLYGAWRLPGRS
jgi:hypothetical protein